MTRSIHKQAGSVIVVTLWTVTLLTILITVIASQNRLTARAAYYQQEELATWAGVLSAVNQAEMELMMERMPRPPEVVQDLDEVDKNPLYRYNGQELQLSYPQAQGVSVRIYDHAGKINLREIGRPRMRALLEKKLGEDQDDRIDDLIAAWGDWLDLNDGEAPNGAERDYYEDLDVPYSPRNGRMETVEEILQVRGFDEVFADVDLEAAFTLYTDNELVNLNLATVEAMRLLPGLDDELIEQIVAWRRENEFRGNGDVAQIVPEENMVELRAWLNSRKVSNFYTIMAYPRITAPEGESEDSLGGEGEAGAPTGEGETAIPPSADISVNAFSEIVEIRSYTERPRILKVNPYENIPARVAFQEEDEG